MVPHTQYPIDMVYPLGLKFSLDYERDPLKLQTNRRFLMLSGGLYDGNRKSTFMSIFRIFFLVTGITQYLLKIIHSDEENTQLVVVEALHWAIVFTSVVTMLISCLWNSSLFLQMEATVKSGFYKYDGNMSEDQIKARAVANRDIQLSTRVFSACCTAALLYSYFKAPLFMEKYQLPYPIWLPFKITGLISYLAGMMWTWFVAEAMVFCACTNWVIYVTMAGHLVGQFRILIMAIEDINYLSEQDGSTEQKKLRVLARIKECVQHNLLLIKFFTDLQTYFNISLLVAAFSTGLILCTLGYLIISPETSMATIGSLLLVLIPELLVAGFYCVLGQRIADVTEDVHNALYNLEWHTKPLSVQRDLLMMMVGSKKTRQLTGLGLHEFSIKGLSEILQASFTYFNMLMALSGGK